MDSQLLQELRSLNQSRFSGCLTITNCASVRNPHTTSVQTWHFFFYLGRIIGDSGGVHPIKRWMRCLHQEIKKLPTVVLGILHEYQERNARSDFLAQQLLESSIIARQDVQTFIEGSLLEVFFDIYQYEIWAQTQQQKPFSYTLQPSNYGDKLFPLVMLKPEYLFTKLLPIWQDWYQRKLLWYSPNLAPCIKNQLKLQQRIAPDVYLEMIQLLDGQHTLRDLAVKLNQNIVTLARSLMYSTEELLVEFQEIPDHSFIQNMTLAPAAANYCRIPRNPDIPIIGYLDRSELNLQFMQQLALEADYGYVGLQDPLQVFSIFIKHRPQIIFLDLAMPNSNTYELFSMLRQIDHFRDTPIVLITGKQKRWDSIRGKIMGVTTFVQKPLQSTEVMNVLGQYTARKYNLNLEKLAKELSLI